MTESIFGGGLSDGRGSVVSATISGVDSGHEFGMEIQIGSG